MKQELIQPLQCVRHNQQVPRAISSRRIGTDAERQVHCTTISYKQHIFPDLEMSNRIKRQGLLILINERISLEPRDCSRPCHKRLGCQPLGTCSWQYHMEEDDNKPILEHAVGTKIGWKPRKDLTIKLMKKKPKKAEELHMEQDYDVGATICDKIVPHAISWFTSKAVEFDDEAGDDEEDEDEDDKVTDDKEEFDAKEEAKQTMPKLSSNPF
ncbi:hypothetical protein SELMODRAFT_425089 [Selaginella moellendorffii]|uniref:Uncharacterized protein n=1 Tax=Selaginella moellendorffii TaxID=88036 RepID=D8SRZ9_SELML|nr:hypothetical protein SELMODRAFT_425089 [Selaginella moellendorffii]